MTAEASREMFEEILDKGIKPYAEEISMLTNRRRFVCVVYQPTGENLEFARSLGWDGSSPLFPLRKRAVYALSKADPAAERFFATKPHLGHARLFAVVQDGAFLMHHETDQGWHLEPARSAASR